MFTRIIKLLCLSLLANVMLMALPPGTTADDHDKATLVTINRPIEIPGKLLLPGKYVFKLLDLAADRNVVCITSEDGNTVYATLLAISDYRLTPTYDSVFTFYEAPARGTPESLRAWFYPNHRIGVEFVYPRRRAVEIADLSKEHVIAENFPVAIEPPATVPAVAVEPRREEPTTTALLEEPIIAIEPGGAVAEIAAVHPPEVFASANAEPLAPTAEPAELPKTASPLPIIGLIGLAAVAAATATRFLRR